ncbi:hypothetical protein MKX01_032563 [Papaver californicum]|nr:hypothetical protein MKX01_032563 [Papaver californicum]
MANTLIVELGGNNKNYASMVEDIVKIEKKLFLKHESLATAFDEELKKKNCGLLYSHVNGEVSGYVMHQWPSSLYASMKDNYRRQGHGVQSALSLSSRSTVGSVFIMPILKGSMDISSLKKYSLI